MADSVVYDKAEYHSRGDFHSDLDEYQAFVHTGMYVAWLIDRDLISDEFMKELQREISACKRREKTGAQVYESRDRCLIDDMLNKTGNSFSAKYFDFEKGMYLVDYGELLADSLPSLYHVRDTWENYDVIKRRIDQRFSSWTATGAIAIDQPHRVTTARPRKTSGR